MRLSRDSIIESDLSLLELEGSRVDDCSYRDCNFSRSYFSDVAFSNTDFSNCNFSRANFAHCTFSSCKFTGADFHEAVLRLVDMSESACPYASFAKAKLEDFSASSSDSAYADIVEAHLKNASFDKVGFTGTNFFHTDLRGIDLTSCQLASASWKEGCLRERYDAIEIGSGRWPSTPTIAIHLPHVAVRKDYPLYTLVCGILSRLVQMGVFQLQANLLDLDFTES